MSNFVELSMDNLLDVDGQRPLIDAPPRPLPPPRSPYPGRDVFPSLMPLGFSDPPKIPSVSPPREWPPEGDRPPLHPIDPVRVIVNSPPPAPLRAVPSSEAEDDRIMAAQSLQEVVEGPATRSPLHMGLFKDDARIFCSVRTFLEALGLFVSIMPIFVASQLQYEHGFYCGCPSDRADKRAICDAPELSYPLAEQSMGPWMLYVICISIPLVAVTIGEFCHFFISKTDYSRMEVKYRLYKRGPRVPPMIVSWTRILVLFFFGLFTTRAITDCLKNAAGTLRPNFLAICDPDPRYVGVHASCDVWIDDFHCRTDPNDLTAQNYLRESRLGFISGHASAAFFCMVFIALYLEVRLRWMNIRYIRALLQYGLVATAALIGQGRAADHWMSWPGVIGGSIVGIIMAFVTVFITGCDFNDRYFLRAKLTSLLTKMDYGSDGGSHGVISRILMMKPRNRFLRKLRHTKKAPVRNS